MGKKLDLSVYASAPATNWTPTLGSSDPSFTYSGGSVLNGYAARQGSIITVGFKLDITTLTRSAGGGNLFVNGLPNDSYFIGACGLSEVFGVTTPAGYSQLMPQVGLNYILFNWISATGGATRQLNTKDITVPGTVRLYGGISYFTLDP